MANNPANSITDFSGGSMAATIMPLLSKYYGCRAEIPGIKKLRKLLGIEQPESFYTTKRDNDGKEHQRALAAQENTLFILQNMLRHKHPKLDQDVWKHVHDICKKHNIITSQYVFDTLINTKINPAPMLLITILNYLQDIANSAFSVGLSQSFGFIIVSEDRTQAIELGLDSESYAHNISHLATRTKTYRSFIRMNMAYEIEEKIEVTDTTIIVPKVPESVANSCIGRRLSDIVQYDHIIDCNISAVLPVIGLDDTTSRFELDQNDPRFKLQYLHKMISEKGFYTPPKR